MKLRIYKRLSKADEIPRIMHEDDFYGYFVFCFWPRRCRDGKLRIGWLEKMSDDTWIKARE